jgi:hypothetical protein
MNILKVISRDTSYSKKVLNERYSYIREYKSEENQKVLAKIDEDIENCNNYYKKSGAFKILNFINSVILTHKINRWEKQQSSITKFANNHFSSSLHYFNQRPSNAQISVESYIKNIEYMQCENCHQFVDWHKVPVIINYNAANYWHKSDIADSPEEYKKKEWFQADTASVSCPYCGHPVF